MALALLTVYLPARSAAEANVVHVDGFTFRLAAKPDSAYRHGLALEVAIEPEPEPQSWLDLAATMPTMGGMEAQLVSVR
ncbi:MAG TPA: hypothetical protein VF157_14920, partial [Chloroflexota bacterium]